MYEDTVRTLELKVTEVKEFYFQKVMEELMIAKAYIKFLEEKQKIERLYENIAKSSR